MYMDTRRLHTDLLVHAGRLLLEYNESTGAIHRALAATARVLTEEVCHIAVSCNGVAVSLAGESPTLMPVRELRYNTAVQARAHMILRQVRRGESGSQSPLRCSPSVPALTQPSPQAPAETVPHPNPRTA